MQCAITAEVRKNEISEDSHNTADLIDLRKAVGRRP
jgi:hypothetical protein